MEKKAFRSGYVSIVGRPNVGKSTLLNTILGQKVSIVTKKPQTTRNRIIGIKTIEGAQIIFIDTPGIHKPVTKFGELMVKESKEAMREVDAILFMVEPRLPGPGEEEVLKLLSKARDRKAVFLLINKVDTVKKPKMLPIMAEYSRIFRFDEIIPVSALQGDGIGVLLERLLAYLPEGPRYYPDDLVTDQLERSMAAEIIREKIMEATSEEVPHAVAVEIVSWEEPEGGAVRISANIWVEREGQKGIIIGKSGQGLKAIGTAARADIERLINARVFLELWVKLKRDWRSDTRAISELGLR
ncbi:MAG: GTPase Era [Nitrospiraceae bacterium]|nr:GTPase Era [Nitrospiraceae bacterium]